MRVRELVSPQDRAQAADFAMKLIRPNMYPDDRIRVAATYAEFAAPLFAVDRTDVDGKAGGFLRDDDAYAPIFAISADDNFLGVAVCSVKTRLLPMRLQMLAIHPDFAGKGLALDLARHAFAAAPVVMGAIDDPAFKRLYRKAGVTAWQDRTGDDGDTYWIGSTKPFPQSLEFGIPVCDDVDGVLLRHGMTAMLGDLYDAAPPQE